MEPTVDISDFQAPPQQYPDLGPVTTVPPVTPVESQPLPPPAAATEQAAPVSEPTPQAAPAAPEAPAAPQKRAGVYSNTDEATLNSYLSSPRTPAHMKEMIQEELAYRRGEPSKATLSPPAVSAVTGKTAPAQEPEQAPKPAMTVPGNVLSAVNTASAKVGVDAKYMLATAKIESSFNPDAKAKTSSATGLFQFIDQTWLGTVKKFGPKHGLEADAALITRDASGRWTVTDPAARARILGLRTNADTNALMGAEFTKENAEVLRGALGREPTHTDLYAAHFMGAGGATKFLAGLAKNPNEAAAQYADPAAVAANTPIYFKPDGSPRTAKEVYDLFAAKLDGRDAVAGPNTKFRTGTEPVSTTLAPPSPVAGTWTNTQAELERARFRAGNQPFFDALSAGFNDNYTGQLIRAGQGLQFQPDPSYRLSPAELEGIPKQYHNRFEGSMSAQQTEWLRAGVKKDIERDTMLTGYGFTATAARIIGGLADPAALSVGIASGAVGTGAATFFNLGRTGSAIFGAGSNLLGDAALNSLTGEEMTVSQALFSAGLGAAFGAAFGPLARNPALAEEAATMTAVANAWRPRAGLGSLADEPTADGIRGAVMIFQNNPRNASELIEGLSQADVAVARGGKARISAAGQVGTSENAEARAVGAALGTDVVGKGAAVNQQASDQRMVQLFHATVARWRSTAMAQYQDWAEEKGIGWFQRSQVWRQGWAEFNEDVTAYVRNSDPNRAAEFSAAVRKAGDEYRAIMGEWADRLRNSGVAGAENLQRNPQYTMRIWSPSKIDAALEKFGEANVIRVVASAIRSAAPEIADKLALKIADRTIKGPRLRAVGEDKLSMLFDTTGDAAKLTSALKAEFGLADDEVEMVLNGLRTKEPNPDARLRHRVDLDEGYVHDLPAGQLAIADLLENDADQLMNRYSRKIAGRVALAETRVFSEADGRLLIDGIKSDNEFEKLLQTVRDSGLNNPEATQKDLKNLQWMYDRILGRPDPAQLNEVGDWLRAVRAFNFSRMMGQLGIAQMMDVGRLANSAGIKSFMQHMEGFRRIRNADGRFILEHGIDRELEAAFGFGTDRLRGFAALADAEAGDIRAFNRGKFVDKLNNKLEASNHIVSEFSGANLVNQWLTLVTGRIAAQKFADIASAAKLSKADMDLIRYMGLNDDMLNRVRNQVRANFEMKDGVLFGRKVTALNLEKWSDIEARAAFERAVMRFSRSAVQQNDIGAMNRVMSHPLAQTLMQFRSYSLTAYENQLLQGVLNPDMRQFNMAAGSALSGALVYMAQVHLQAVGRSDAPEFVEKRLGDPLKFGLAVFQRTGPSSVVPMLVDTFQTLTGGKALFDGRTTSQPTDFIFGNPTAGLATDIGKFAKAVRTSTWEGRPMTQSEMRDAQRLLILQNTMPMMQVYNGLISDRPQK